MSTHRSAVGMERKLAAILSADVAGYSRLMGEDEEATICTLTAYRQVMASLIQHYRGRVVDAPGDNLLAEFASVVDAVRCAVEIQQELKVKNAELPSQRQMQFRIGINLGDVIVEGERLYGDGVNIAARLESLAEPGGICISGKVFEEVESKLALTYEYQGEQTVKNIVKPVRAYRVVMDAAAAALAEQGVLRSFDSAQDRRTQHERKSTSLPRNDSKPRRVGIAHRSRTVLLLAGLLLIAGTIAALRYFSRPSLSTQDSALRTEAAPAALPLPDKPSLIVLPFVNMSKDPDQEYFSDGLTEDLTSDLSQISSLFVIARNSAFTYKGKAVKVQDVSKEMGVRYVLEGSVQKADQRVRITTQLIDATTGYHLWSEQYDRPLKDIFALQDEITQKIVAALKVQLTAREQEYVLRRNTDNLEAYDYLLRGWTYYLRYTKEANAQARQMCERAIELDPGYADAYAVLAGTYWVEWAVQWNPDPQNLARAFELTQKAVALDDSLPSAHLVLGVLYLWRSKQYEQAVTEVEKAIALDPNNADAYWVLAEILNSAGVADRAEEAVRLLEKAMRLNPHYPAPYVYNLGAAYQKMGRDEEAITAYKRAITLNPDYLPPHQDLAVIYSESGRAEEARAEVAEILRISPNFSLEVVRQISPTKDQAGLERFIAALRKAGLK